jgi:hypothetical protein
MRVLLNARKTLLSDSSGGDDDGRQLSIRLWKLGLKKHAEVKHLMLVNRNDEDSYIWLQEPLRQPQSLLHECEPLAVSPRVAAVDVVVVVFPVPDSRPLGSESLAQAFVADLDNQVVDGGH